MGFRLFSVLRKMETSFAWASNLTCALSTDIPLISGLFCIAFESGFKTRQNKVGDRGQPCQTDFFTLKDGDPIDPDRITVSGEFCM